MTYFDELRDGAGAHFAEWLRALTAGESSARAAAWGLRLDLGGLAPATAFERVAEAVDTYASRHRVLYVAATCGGPYDEADVAWLEERAAAMTDAEVLRMAPFDEAMEHEISRHVARASTPQVDHWTRRPIPPGQRHMVLRETLMGRENETRRSELSAYLHVVAGDGGATEFLEAYDEAVALAS